MIKTDKNIICFPTVPWNHNWERQHEFIHFLASITSGRVIVHQPYGMINHNVKTVFQKFRTIRKALGEEANSQSNPILPNMEFVQTKFLPRHHNGTIDRLNSHLIGKATPVNFESAIVYATYVNSFTFSLFKKAKFSILDLAARRQKLLELSSKFKQLEKEVVAKADVVFVDNIKTIEDYQDLNSNLNYLPQGVNPERFTKVENGDLKKWREGYKTVVGYSGSDIVMDYELLHALISKNSDVLFLFVGNMARPESQALQEYANVRFTGRINYTDLGQYYALFDIGLIPYILNDRTSGVFPTKLFEYLAADIPVLSTGLPDLVKFNEPFISIMDQNSCSQELRELMNLEIDKRDLISFVAKNTWESRFKLVTEKIMRAL